MRSVRSRRRAARAWSPTAQAAHGTTQTGLLGILVVAGVMSLSACGSSVDKDGFTAGDRTAVQHALQDMTGTSLPTTLVTLTSTARLAPAVCLVHLESSKPAKFRLFLFWRPYDVRDTGHAYTWLDATIGDESIVTDAFHVGVADGRQPYRRVLNAHIGDAQKKPDKKCQVEMDGSVALMAST